MKKKETETIDKLYLELSQFTTAKTKNDIDLQKLLSTVETKFPGESRFETALRYIGECEFKRHVATSKIKARSWPIV